MRALRELAGGVLIALVTIATVIGGIFLAVSDSGGPAQPEAIGAATSTGAQLPQDTPADRPPALTTPSPATSEHSHAPTSPASDTASETPTLTQPATPSQSPSIEPTASVPASPVPAVAASPTPCGPPSTWVPYVIRRGDTLFQLSLRFAVSTQQLQAANCLASTDIKFGQVLYVPFVPTATSPSPTPTAVPTATPVPEPLQILNVSLANVVRDGSRPNGAIAFVHISFTGGAAPYTFFDEDLPQPGNPMQILTECDGTLIHTARVASADGQSASETYFFAPIACP
jgi:LysM repeat protein